MATEPVGRSRIRSDEVVVPGRAIPRMCHGEEDEEWLAQRDHLVEECERAIDLDHAARANARLNQGTAHRIY